MVSADEIHPDVVDETLIACSDDPSSKETEHYRSRRKLFAEVDRLIRGRVKEVLPVVTLEFKQQIDKDLGLDALRDRVRRVANGVSKDLDALEEHVETSAKKRVDELFVRLSEETADAMLAMFVSKATVLVGKEVGRQLGLLLAKSAPVEHRVRAKKKRKQTKG